MKTRKQILCALLAGLCVMGFTVQAEETTDTVTESSADEMNGDTGNETTTDVDSEVEPEDNPYYMEPEGSYQIDLNGDGELEMIRYETYTEETDEGVKGKLEIYRNDEILYRMEGNIGSYGWSVSHCPMPDGKNYLLAYCRSDNDWTDQAFLLEQKDEDSLTVVGEFCSISRKEDEESENFLTGWARLNWVPLVDIGEDSITLNWIDTLYGAGIVQIPVEYQITEDGLVAAEPPYKFADQEKEWTAHEDLTIMKEPGSEEIAFEVKTGEVVKLTAVTSVDGAYYLECENEAGETGWLKDADEVEYHEEDGTYGYFKEGMFAG